MPTRISRLFDRLRGEGRAGLVAYITAGDPHPSRTPTIVEALERGGADLIELGVPFSDPIADGPVIQEAFGAALAKKLKLADVFATIKKARRSRQNCVADETTAR